MQPEAIYQTVQSDFAAVDTLIKTQLFSKVPLVEHIGHYIVDSGGKRLRPLLVLLVGNALGGTNGAQGGNDAKQRQDGFHQHLAKLATIIEFLHTATLLHDDVVDTSDMRRGRDTANAKWGNAPSVLVGDFLYSRAFEMMVELGDMHIMSILAAATNVIAEGEVLQLSNTRNPDITLEQYLEVITAKTAKLFEAASHTAAVLAAGDINQQTAMQSFGLELGIAFQLIDDVLDYAGNAADMGKNVGDDLAEGKPTLPLLYAQNHSSEANRKLLRKAIRQGGDELLQDVVNIVMGSGALEHTRKLAKNYADQAADRLKVLPSSNYKKALEGLVEIAVSRNK